MPSGSRRVTALGKVDPELSPYVVVATQGIWDEEALGGRPAARRSRTWAWSPRRPAPASCARGCATRRTSPEERLAALRAPAGIDLGAETPEEIALSILAELVQVRRGRASFVAQPGPATLAGGDAGIDPLAEAGLAPVVDDIVLLDPVCGMTVDREHARHLAEHDGVVYAFCSMGCRTAFIKQPGAYVPGSTPAEA